MCMYRMGTISNGSLNGRFTNKTASFQALERVILMPLG